MTTAPPARSLSSREAWWLLAILLLAAFVRFDRLGAQSLWIDEFLMIQRASLGEPFRWSDWFANPQGPLPALLLRIWTGLAGTSEWALRFPSAVFGILTVFVTARLAGRLDRRALLPAALLATLSPFLLWYAQETRHYALALLAGAWLAHALFRFEEEGNWPAAIEYGLALLVGLMSHLSFVFVAAAHGLCLLVFRRDRFARWTGVVIPVFLVLLPWIWVAVTRNLNLDHVASTAPIPTEEKLRGESTFTWLGIPYTAFVFFAGYSLGPTLTELHDAPRLATIRPHLPLIGILAVGAGGLFLAGFRHLRPVPFRPAVTAAWVLLPLVAVVFLATRNAKVFNPRYLSPVVPLLFAVVALGWVWLRAARPRLSAVLAVALLVPTLLALWNYREDPAYMREDARAAAHYLAAETGERDLVLGVGAPQLLLWYGHGDAPMQMVFDVWLRDAAGLEARVSEWAEGRERLWLYLARPWLQDPTGRLEALLNQRYGSPVERRFPGVRVLAYDVSTGVEGSRR
jgi:uncharacterized membrane protein